jgi:hypothetical protein
MERKGATLHNAPSRPQHWSSKRGPSKGRHIRNRLLQSPSLARCSRTRIVQGRFITRSDVGSWRTFKWKTGCIDWKWVFWVGCESVPMRNWLADSLIRSQILPVISKDSSTKVTNFCRTPSWFVPRVSGVTCAYRYIIERSSIWLRNPTLYLNGRSGASDTSRMR